MLLQSVRAVKMVKTHIGVQAALPWFRTLTAETRVVVCVRFVVDSFLQTLLVYPVSIIPPMLHTHLHFLLILLLSEGQAG